MHRKKFHYFFFDFFLGGSFGTVGEADDKGRWGPSSGTSFVRSYLI